MRTCNDHIADQNDRSNDEDPLKRSKRDLGDHQDDNMEEELATSDAMSKKRKSCVSGHSSFKAKVAYVMVRIVRGLADDIFDTSDVRTVKTD